MSEDVSEELVDMACEAYSPSVSQKWAGWSETAKATFRGKIRAALNAIAPRLRAQGMREAAERARSHRLGILQLAADLEARADALTKETK